MAIVIGARSGACGFGSIRWSWVLWSLAPFAAVIVLASSGVIAQTLVIADGAGYRLAGGAVEAVPHFAGNMPLAATRSGVWFAGPKGLEFRLFGGETPSTSEARAQVPSAHWTPVDAATHALSGDLWMVTAERQLVRIGTAGEVRGVTPLADAPLRLATTSDDSSWVLGHDSLLRLAADSTVLRHWTLESLAVPRAHLLVVDPVGDTAWVASDQVVVRVDGRSGSAIPLVRDALPVVGLAYDAEAQRLWVAAEGELLALDERAVRLRLDSLQVGATRFRALGWDPRQRSLLLADEGGMILLDADSLVATRVLRDVHVDRFLPAGFRFRPVVDAVESADGVIAFPGAACEGRRCDLGARYQLGMTVTASVDDRAYPLVHDVAGGGWRLPVTAPKLAGKGAIRIDVEDLFGQMASTTVSLVQADVSERTRQEREGAKLKAGGKNQPPVVSLLAPADGAVLVRPDGPGDWSISLQAQASDPDGRVTQVEFRSGSTVLATRASEPWTHTWINPPPGPHTLTAIATDDRKAKTTSASSSVRINANPSLAIVAPADGAMLDGSATLSIQVNASDTDGNVTRVDFHGDGALLDSLTSPPFTTTWAAVSAGPHLIEVRAIDNDGGEARRTVSISVESPRPPMVVLTKPEPCSIVDVSGSLVLAAEAASLENEITRVDFHAGDSLIASATSKPFQVRWMLPTPGAHLLTARAYDSAGQTATSKAVPVTVRSANAPPSVWLTSPQAGSTVLAGDTVTVGAVASDPDGSVARVEFLANDVPLGSDDTAPYTVAWAPAAAGAVTLKARATDDLGSTTDSAETLINVASNSPPRVSLLSPGDGMTYWAPASIAALASASDDDGVIARVDFLIDGVVFTGDSDPPYGAPLTIASPGSHTIVARATDDLGATTDSQGVTVSVSVNAPPQVTLTSPVAGSRLLAPVSISLAASAIDTDGAIVRVEFFQGSAFLGSVTEAPYVLAWNDVAPGTYSLTAVAVDDAGARTTSSPVTAIVEPFSVAIDSVVGGTGMYGSTAQVTGTVQAPIGSAVTVNDSIAAIGADGTFHVEVPLAAGENTLRARVSTLDGAAAEAISSVTSDGVTPQVLVTAHPLSGLAPLRVVFTVENRTPGAVDARFDGGAPASVAVGASARFEATFPAAGTYPMVVDITDVRGVTASRSFVIVAHNYADADAELRATYDALIGRLRTGDIPGALRFVTPALHADYQDMFEAMGPGLVAAVDQLGFLESGPIGPGMAEYVLVRDVDGVPTVFFVYFVQGADGLWRVGGM